MDWKAAGFEQNQDWKEEDFKSFWSHYDAVQKWINVEAESRNECLDSWEQPQKQQPPPKAKKSKSHVQKSFMLPVQEETADSGEEELSQDLLEFFSKTLEHRKKRDEQRRLQKQMDAEEQQKTIDDCGSASASTIGQTGKANANHPNRIAARQSMYGDFLPKLDLLENSIQDGFQQEMHKKGATQTWPNISMRL